MAGTWDTAVMGSPWARVCDPMGGQGPILLTLGSPALDPHESMSNNKLCTKGRSVLYSRRPIGARTHLPDLGTPPVPPLPVGGGRITVQVADPLTTDHHSPPPQMFRPETTAAFKQK